MTQTVLFRLALMSASVVGLAACGDEGKSNEIVSEVSTKAQGYENREMSMTGMVPIQTKVDRPLSSEEIRNLVHDTSIVLALDSQDKVVPFGEQFDANGNWLGTYQSRGPVVIKGRWYTKGDELCVATQRDGEVCRAIWQLSDRNSYLIASYFDMLHGKKVNIHVNFKR